VDRNAARVAVVREHMESENRHDFEATLATFSHPRYELIATGEVYDGREEVLGYYAATRAAFADQRNEVRAIHAAERSVVVEFDLLGTHTGSLRGIPGTGRSFRCAMAAVFEFGPAPEPPGELIVCERVYFDARSLLAQLDLA
jgi:steroid delta-isomerase-like uncharacterized protein